MGAISGQEWPCQRLKRLAHINDRLSKNRLNFAHSLRVRQPRAQADTGDVWTDFVAHRNEARMIQLKGIRVSQQLHQPLLGAM